MQIGRRSRASECPVFNDVEWLEGHFSDVCVADAQTASDS